MWWGRSDGEAPEGLARTARWVTGAFLLVLLLLVTEGRPWELFVRGPYTADFYDAQASAFWRLRLDVPWEVAVIEGFEIGDRTYLYFGPFLALARMPFSWIPGIDGRLTGLSLLVGGAVLAAGAFALLCEARARLRPEGTGSKRPATPGERWRAGLFMGAVLASPLVFLGAERTVYHETEMWGCALAVWTAAWAMQALRTGQLRPAVLAGAAAAACALTRISVGLGAVAAVGVLAVLLWRRASRPAAAIGAAIAAAGVVAHMAVNYLRFSSLTSVPFDRQTLTLVSPERAAWFEENGWSFFGLRFVPTNLVHYLRPDTLVAERLVPFVRFGERARELFGVQLETSSRAGSITATAPLLVVLAVLGVVVLARQRQWAWLGVAAAISIGAVPVLAIGFTAHRYLADLIPVFVVLAAAGAWWTVASRWVGLLRAAGTAVLVVSLWVNAGLAWWVQSFRDPWFTDVRYRLDEAVFGGAPPSVVRMDGGRTPRDGLVGIAGECEALYIGDGDQWRPLERPLGERRVVARVVPPGEGLVPVVGGPDWTVGLAVVAPGELSVEVELPDGTVARSAIEVAAAGEIEIEVIADPTLGLLQVAVDGTTAFARFLPGPQLPVVAFEGVEVLGPESPGGGAPVCERLLARLAS